MVYFLTLLLGTMSSFEHVVLSSLQRLYVPGGLNDNLEVIVLFTNESGNACADRSREREVQNFVPLLNMLLPKRFSKAWAFFDRNESEDSEDEWGSEDKWGSEEGDCG